MAEPGFCPVSWCEYPDFLDNIVQETQGKQAEQ